MSSTVTESRSAEPGKANGQVEPPTNKTFPADYAKRRLVKKQPLHENIKKMVWLAGHISVVVFGLITILFQVLWLPNRWYINSICYRLALVGAMAALAATASHKFGLRNLPSISALLAHQNFQYLVLAAAWCVTFKSVFKLLPYFLLSILQLSLLKDVSVVLRQLEFLASVIAYDELFLIGYLLLRTLFFRNTSGYQLVLVVTFYWLRILFNKETGNLFRSIMQKLDTRVTSFKNEKVTKVWKKSKAYLESKEHQGDI